MDQRRRRNFNCRATDELFDQLEEIRLVDIREGKHPSQADIIHRLVSAEHERLCKSAKSC